ncbi:CBS domain-containing protein [Natronoarchaeum rubrum]|uniref:CBS domain-containing protein n=1 Tax=Natronoarchaeum rubrum TaxID=755311 RepID=UPI002112B4B9|nr:CBS domain-containing protein [Natronoarchaeum rubrum]
MIDVPVAAVASATAPEVSPETTTVEAASRLRRPEVPALVVCDRTSVVGIVTESDVVAAVAERGTDRPVESYMSSPVVTARPSTPVGIAADRMRDAGITLLAVVEDGAYEGVVTRRSLRPYVSRRRLAVDWDGEPLSLDDPNAADAPGGEDCDA